jgi:hypothetical protein
MNSLSRFSLILLLSCSAAFAQSHAQEGFRALHVDAGKAIGEIRDFQGLNGQPTPVMAGLPNLTRQYGELHTSLVRTHDMMGPTDIDAKFDFKNVFLAWLIPEAAARQGVVEAGNKGSVFLDWTADPEKPESYNFEPTDEVMAAIHASGAKVYYRIGRSWGAQPEPPADFDKFASVVKHVAMHYNQGWANGFHYGIRYWEFWNEPGDVFWTGTPEQFYLLYEKTARALKSADPELKIGGPAIADPAHPSPYREGLLDYCKAHRAPFDFYSWHTYAIDSADPYDAVRLAKNFRALLDGHGYTKAESILSEWNLTPDFTEGEKAELQGEHNAAFVGAVLSYLQDAPLDKAMFYRGDATWMGLFDLQGNYFKPAYTFRAMGQMLETPVRLAVDGADTYGFAALAGRSRDGKTVQLILSNYEIPAGYKPRQMTLSPELEEREKRAQAAEAAKPKSAQPAPASELPQRAGMIYRDNAGYNLTLANLPWGSASCAMKRYRIGKTQSLDLVEEKALRGDTLRLSNALPPDTVELIVLERQ